MADAFRDAHARLELALAGALERIAAIGTPAEIERLVKLIIKHKIVTEMLFEVIEVGEAYDDNGQEAADGVPSDQPLLSDLSSSTEDSRDSSANSSACHPPDVAEDC